MDKKQSLYIAGSSVISPIGNTLAMTHSALKCGISAIGETPFFNDKNYPVKGAMIPNDLLPPCPENLSTYSGRTRRLLQLSLAGLETLKPQLEHLGDIPFLLAGPELLPSPGGIGSPVGTAFFRLLHEAASLNLDSSHCRYIASGRPGGLELLAQAGQYLQKGFGDTVLIGAVDTFFDPATIASLDAERRVMAINRNAGFFPGEAAVFLLLTTDRNQASLKAGLSPPCISFENSHYYSGKPCLGDALTEVFRTLLSHQATAPISQLWTTVNGERFSIKEVAIAITRNAKRFSDGYSHLHPADCLGDCGAAAGLLLAALAAQDAENTTTAGAASLVVAASDMKNRAGLIVSRLISPGA